MSCLKPSFTSMLRVAMLCLTLAAAPCQAQNIWVNELHYDNVGTDQNEFLEIALENPPGYSLSDFTVSLYSGTTLSAYSSKTLNNFTVGNNYGNFTLFYFVFPTDGIQNNTAGITIDYQGHLIKLISYKGTFTPISGAASGVLSEDIGVQESSSSSVGLSLQLSGNGNQYEEFYWTGPSDDTPGEINVNQSFVSNPVITVSAPAGGYDFGLITYGKNTQSRSYTIVGANLTGDLSVTPPSGFQVSLDPGFNALYTSTSPLIISPTGGTIKPLQLYVRFSPVAQSGAISAGAIVHSSTGASDAGIPVKGTEGSPNAWINEFHYNDIGVDANEFIEVIIKNVANYNLSDFSVLLYNGSSGTVYDQETLDHFNAGQTFSDYSVYALDFTDHSFFNLQNGPDGIALAYQGNMIVFISYQGSFMAMDGPAANSLSENLAPSESNSTPENSSIYLINALTPGSTYSDFTWAQSLGSNTMGSVNPLEVLPIVLKSFTLNVHDGLAELEWTTSSEINNEGFAVEKSVDGSEFQNIGFVKSQGNSGTLISYQFEDREFSRTAYYRLKQIDLDNKTTYSKVIIAESTLDRYHFYPNPVNVNSTISIGSLSQSDLLAVEVIDSQGVTIFSTIDTQEIVNKHLRKHFLESQVSGVYHIKLLYNNTIEVIKVVVL